MSVKILINLLIDFTLIWLAIYLLFFVAFPRLLKLYRKSVARKNSYEKEIININKKK